MTTTDAPEPIVAPHPCAACVSAGQAILQLSTSLRIAKEALASAEEAMKRVTLPLPNDVAIEMGYGPVDLDNIPPAIRDYCQKNDMHILQAQPGVVHARAILNHNSHTSSNLPAATPSVIPSAGVPIGHFDGTSFSSFSRNDIKASSTPADNEGPVSPLVTPGTVVVDGKGDHHSISSDSTDWEREYSVDPSSTAEIENLIRDTTLENVTTTHPTSADHTPADLRWYVVYVGREPGVIQGANNMLTNIEGIPRNHSFRVPSETIGRQIFLQAVEEGKVIQVQTVRQEKRLTLTDITSQ